MQQKLIVMNSLYPLKFTPVFLEKIWGGTKLLKTYNVEGQFNNIGEVWLLSAVEGNESVVSNGFLQGNTVNELTEVYLGDLIGENVFDQYGSEFPLLVKILDTADWLSVQVHPDDELAQKKHSLPNGKTEMWYVMNGDEKAEIISGFKVESDRIRVKAALDNNSLGDLLQSYKTQKGDLFFTPSGMIHAIGPGVTLAEIQQSSDVTYRLWDWNRKDNEGKSRELHIEDGLDALKYELEEGGKTEYLIPENGSNNLVACPQFTTNLIKLNKGMLLQKDLFPIDSFVLYLCTDGSARLITENGSESISEGELVMIPAIENEVQIVAAENATILETYIA